MAHSEVEERAGGDRLVAEALPDLIVSWPPNEVPMTVLVQVVPEILSPFQSSCQFKTRLDSFNV